MDSRNGTFPGSFGDCLDSPEGRRKALHQLHFFSGQSEITPLEEPAALIRPRHNIGRFALIGFLDDLSGFAQGFADLFGRGRGSANTTAPKIRASP